MKAPAGSDTIALELERVSKDFGGLRVLNDVSLRVRRGERVTVIGPNGAGKTTLFNVICGLLPPTRGRVSLFGRDVTALPAHRRMRLGLGRGFQITTLFPELTVRESAMLTAIRRAGKDYEFYRPFGDGAAAARAAEEVLADWGFERKAGARVRELSYGDQRRLDICLAMLMRPTVLLLDEPTAGLSGADSASIVELVKGLPPELSCLVVTHDLRFGFEVAQRVVALHQGQVVIEGSPGEVQADRVLRAMYF